MFGRLTLPSHGPVFLNEGATRSELELRKMEALRSAVPNDKREDLERDIRLTQAGVAGERKIVFELMNGHYPLVFIHDLCLEHEGLRAQIDFLVVTPYHTLVIECKNLVGDIEIDSTGAFVRTFGQGRGRRREGIYSPVSQNRRHVDLLKTVRMSGSGSVRRLAQRFVLDEYYQSVVVLANERTLLKADDAPPEVRQQVIRADQLVDYIKRLDATRSRKDLVETFKNMEVRCGRWLELNSPRRSDLADRYGIVASLAANPSTGEVEEPLRGSVAAPLAIEPRQGANESNGAVPSCPRCGAPMVLRTARYGVRKGKKFWGCSTYGKTRCGGIINIDEG
ncbi:MAG: NERD domain-containing protein [Atopobiaceae bacterium]|nr:NERD domain-containing protein [Atopobiaceae bacterium]